MLNELIKTINEYVKYLNQTGLYVTVHGNISEYIHSLTKIDIHSCPYCLMIKINNGAWEKCIKSQEKIYEKNCTEPFWGMCYAGVEEYIFPLKSSDKMFGFVCVSGYGVDTKKAMPRIDAAAEKFMINRDELLNTYRNLNHKKPNIRELSAVIAPLVQMLVFLKYIRPSFMKKDIIDNQVYNMTLQYIERRYMQHISVSDIASYCGCSVSTVSHTFSRYAGQTIQQYITFLRIEQAKKLLKNTMLPMKTISAMCGFGEPDYFSTVFKRSTGFSPTKVRDNSGQ